ncbi:MAG: hypothetical protein IPL65_10220 [Lewinellaceae bacterium]|nr:hypothetical protein [Lewinellaceae bacterium]
MIGMPAHGSNSGPLFMPQLMLRTTLLLLSLLSLSACYTHQPRTTFNPSLTPPQPDYANLQNWAAHPDKRDPADQVPCNTIEALEERQVDVFFLPYYADGQPTRRKCVECRHPQCEAQ